MRWRRHVLARALPEATPQGREHEKRKDAALRVEAARRKDGKGRDRKAKADAARRA